MELPVQAWRRPLQGEAVDFDRQKSPNPHIAFPLTNIWLEINQNGQGDIVGRADVTREFIAEQLAPRPEPHVSTVHVGPINDAVSVVTFKGATQQDHGQWTRIVQRECVVKYLAEGFVRGFHEAIPASARLVDRLEVVWHCFPRIHAPVFKSGICCITVLGHNDGEEVGLLQALVTYIRVPAAAPVLVP